MVEVLNVADLRPYGKNPRKHSDDHLRQLWASIVEFGWTQPILIDEENLILAGHGRYGAAKIGGLERVPCLRLIGLSNAQKQAVIVSDNKLTENSTWDQGLLMAEIAELIEVDFDISILGFSENELDDLLGTSEESEDQSEDLNNGVFEILLECTNEAEQVKLLEEFDERGIKCRALI